MSIFSITIYPVLLGKFVPLVNPIVVAEAVIFPDKYLKITSFLPITYGELPTLTGN